MVQIIPYQDKYKESTIRFVLNILENEFKLTQVKRPDLYKIPEVYQKKKSNFWLAIENNEVVGTIALVDYGNNRAYLKRMYVDQRLRGAGLAKNLLETLINFAKQNNYKEIFIGTVDEMIAANKFYLKNGFVKINSLPKDLPDCGDTLFYVLKI